MKWTYYIIGIHFIIILIDKVRGSVWGGEEELGDDRSVTIKIGTFRFGLCSCIERSAITDPSTRENITINIIL